NAPCSMTDLATERNQRSSRPVAAWIARVLGVAVLAAVAVGVVQWGQAAEVVSAGRVASENEEPAASDAHEADDEVAAAAAGLGEIFETEPPTADVAASDGAGTVAEAAGSRFGREIFLLSEEGRHFAGD